MALAAILAVTLDPALRMMFARIDPYTFKPKFLATVATHALVGTYHSEEKHPISRALHRVYEPACRFVLRRPKAVIAVALAMVALSVPVYFKLAASSCRRSTKAPCSTCRRRCRGFPSRRRRTCWSGRTGC